MFVSGFRQLLFVFLCTVPIVFCSENVYAYPQPLGLPVQALYYCMCTIPAFWAIEFFRVRRFAPLFLCAGIFGWCVEGLLTPVLYEAGPFDPVMVVWPSVSWHALLSFVGCWYFLRLWLVRRKIVRLAVFSAVFGLFMGGWSLTYELPEVVYVPEEIMERMSPEVYAALDSEDPNRAYGLARSAEERDLITKALGSHEFSLARYAAYAFGRVATIVLALYLLNWFWVDSFRSRLLLVVALVLLGLHFFPMIVPAIPWSPLKFVAVMALAMGPLWLNRKRERRKNVFRELKGKVKLLHLPVLFLAPAGATALYGWHLENPFSEQLIRAVFYEGQKTALLALGGALLLWSIWRTISRR